MRDKTKLLIVHHRHELYREYLENHSDAFEIESIDFKEPIPFETSDAEILFCWKIQDGLLERLPHLKWIAAVSAGVDHILKLLPNDSSIPITRAQGTMGQYMAEYVIQHILNHVKNYPTTVRQKEDKIWRHVKTDLISRYTLGILGLGAIGKQIASLAKVVGMHVIASKKSGTDGLAGDLVDVDELFLGDDWHKLLLVSDYLVVTVPRTPETIGLIGEKELSKMKQEAVLINIARGDIVNEDALVSALRERTISSAVIDVFEEEPLPMNHPFWNLQNVVITPHCSGPSEEDSICEEFLENYDRWTKNEPLKLLVDRAKGY